MLRLLLICWLAALALPTLAQNRHALVIGIDTYAHVPSLQKARNDARDVVAALDASDFRTELVLDPDENTLLSSLARFAGQLDPGDEAVFYFAGHGVEIDGRNYLLPADVPDVPPGQELIVTRRALPVDEVIDAFQRRGARLSLLILDACRDNPFEQVAGRSVGRTRGLGQSEPPEGTFIMYSAGAGQSALDALSRDDPERNSVFTRALLPRMSEPGLDLRVMVRQLRSEVRQLARTVGHNQFPAVYDQLDGEFQFIPAAVTPEPAPGPAADPCAAAAAVWASVEAAESIAALENFKQIYGETCQVFAALALDRLTALRMAVPGSVFQECPDCPEMVVIPSGSFTMGSMSNEVGRFDDEGPRRNVRIARPFAMGVYEVTFAQWDACAAAGFCTRGVDHRGWGRGARPVINVSWDDVQEFIRWMNSKVDGNPYRLPSEAEWEYAARAGSDTAFWWGNRISPDQANYRSSTAYNNGPTGVYRRQTLPVGSFAANPFGLFDVHGNVWEWVQDCYVDGYAGAPRDGSARSSSGCSQRVLRGGSWNANPRNLRSANRDWLRPDNRYRIIGFRLARTLTP